MKSKKLSLKAAALLFGLLLAVFGATGAFTAFAEEGAESEEQSSYFEEVSDTVPEELPTEPQTEYIEPETEQPETEPVQTEPPDQTEPVETEPVQTEAATEYGGYVEPEPEPTYFEPPTVPKTVSEKTYSTNYLAGIVSWCCVGVGLTVVLAALISTKASGRRAS